MIGKLHSPVLRSVLIAAAVMAFLGLAAPADAQYGAWAFSKNIDVRAVDFDRDDAPVEVNVNFTTWLALGGGAGKTLDLNSIRVVEYSDAGRTNLVGETASQLDPVAGFDGKTNARGELVWLLEGITSAGATRYYKVYFDVTENGVKPAPNYNTGLTWDDNAKQVTTPAYTAALSGTRDGVKTLVNKVPGAPATMWDATEAGYPHFGSWHTLLQDQFFSGWVDSFGGEDVAQHTVVAGPVRVIVNTVRNEGRVKFITKRVFYAGDPDVAFFKVNVEALNQPENLGSGIVWANRAVWTLENASADRTLVPPSNRTDGNPLYKYVYDYGVDGGVGIAASEVWTPNVSEEYEEDGITMHSAEFESWGRTWELGAYPIYYKYAFVVHGEETEWQADEALQKAFNRYNTPVVAVVQNENALMGTVTDMLTAEPVENAIVRVKVGSFYSATTRSSANGTFQFTAVPGGNASMTVKAEDYAYYTASKSITSGLNTQNVMLMPNESIDLRSVATGGTADWILGTDVLNGGPVNPPNDNFAAPGASEAGFVETLVPGQWEGQQYGDWDVEYGWYRTHVAVPGSWAGKYLRLRDFRAEDSDETYMNGTKIGQMGTFPPPSDPRNGDIDQMPAFPRTYWIPPAAVNAGADNVIAIRVVDADVGLIAEVGGLTHAHPILEVAPPFATLSGKISTQGGQGILGAEVELVGVGKVTTGADGMYSFQYVLGDVYTLNVSAFGFKSQSLSVDVPDTGTLTRNVTLESGASISGTVTRNGNPFHRCRVWWTGPTSGTMLTDEDGEYAFTAVAGSYTVLFNGWRAVPKTEVVEVAGSQTLNVDLETGLTPVYDGFETPPLDMSRWEYFNMEPQAGAGNAVATVQNGYLKVEVAPHRGGVRSTAIFPNVATHEVMFPRAYEGANQLYNLYGGTGGFGNFVEFGQEGYFLGTPRTQVWGTSGNHGSASWVGYPFSMGVVRTHNYYDFYIDGHYWHSDTSPGLSEQQARIYLYGYEPADGNSIAYFAAVAAGTPIPPTAMDLGAARSSQTGTPVEVSGAVVTATFGESFFIQTPDRASGIRVMGFPGLPFFTPPNPFPTPGQVVNVSGRIAHVHGEAVLQMADFTVTGSMAVPEPVATNNKVVGEMDGDGAKVQGMRTTVFGKVSGLRYDDNLNLLGFFLNDGADLPGDGVNKGIYVPTPQAWQDEGWLPPFGPDFFPEWATATGVLTVTDINGTPVPTLRATSSSDVTVEMVF